MAGGLVAAETAAPAPPAPVNTVVVVVLLAGIASLVIVAIRRAPRAGEIQAEAGQQVEIPMRAGTGTLVESGRVPKHHTVSREPL